ncbi:hypothetical protein A0J48_016680 [Sphaerospermopsis aphanizomenoides BCCUSP55]|uniref:hypothetical protein n=1 Tax=Sphaerospermopsis aphanizomenoides TaxID=459663 RepID=UPI0019050A07|nr:hypothetical protein [Sphaerospermopsis aphanizomenoides]MBK1989155.1 hypothetical protein [Sphaerospermopsis aphanizomenoides BCCUSP55]
MKLPIQSAPVIRQVSTASYASNAVTPSASCNCPNTCIGLCIEGRCNGLCV